MLTPLHHHQPSPDEIVALRQQHYDATVVSIRWAHPELAVFRIRPDGVPLHFIPGQYTTLGLGRWEPCDAGSAPFDPRDGDRRGMIRRAYSFACGMVDAQGELVTAGREAELEFYITLVPGTADHLPGLTPRLFALNVGDRLELGRHPKGHYTLEPVQPDDDVVFAATGTGEAPHNAMITQLLKCGHRGRVLSVVGVRYRKDLAYEQIHRQLERRYDNYRYVTLTTREPENLDASRADYMGKQYVQQFFERGHWDAIWNHEIKPDRTQVFVCGNPQMIGIPHSDADGGREYPQPCGLIEVLESRGLRADWRHQLGNIHFEKYW